MLTESGIIWGTVPVPDGNEQTGLVQLKLY